MKRILFSTFLVGSSLLFGDLYASNSFNDVDTANGSSTKTSRPNTFKSIVQKNEVVPLEEHEKLLSQLKESQEKHKSLEEEFAAFKMEAASKEEELLELGKLRALSDSASSKSKFLQTIASPFFLEFEKGVASAIKKARVESNMDFERMDEEINAMLIYALLRPEAFFPALMGPLLNSLGDQNEAMKIFATFTNGGYTLVDESPFSYNFQAHTKAIGLNFGKGIDPEEMGGKVETKENTLLREKEEELKREQEEKERIAREEEEKKAAAVPVYKSADTLRSEVLSKGDFMASSLVSSTFDLAEIQKIAQGLGISLTEEQ